MPLHQEGGITALFTLHYLMNSSEITTRISVLAKIHIIPQYTYNSASQAEPNLNLRKKLISRCNKILAFAVSTVAYAFQLITKGGQRR